MAGSDVLARFGNHYKGESLRKGIKRNAPERPGMAEAIYIIYMYMYMYLCILTLIHLEM